MELKNKLIFILPLLLFGKIFANDIKLPKLATKQNIKNIRFISKDGKFTYYQKYSGSLFLSTNYSVTPVIPSIKGVQFNVYSSSARKKILVEKNSSYLNYMSVRSEKEIFELDFGSNQATLIGKGSSPQLHLNDKWASYYLPFKQEIVLQGLYDKSLLHKIALENRINPYFTPYRVMINISTMLFTDINKDGYQMVKQFDLKTKSTKTLFELKSVDHFLELCLSDKSLFLGKFPYDQKVKSSDIHKFNIEEQLDFSKNIPIYSSKHSDTGNLVCDHELDHLYFISQVPNEIGKDIQEVTKFNLKTKKKTILTSKRFISQLIQMDGKLIIPYLGEYYLVIGKNDHTQDNFLKDGIGDDEVEKKQ